MGITIELSSSRLVSESASLISRWLLDRCNQRQSASVAFLCRPAAWGGLPLTSVSSRFQPCASVMVAVVKTGALANSSRRSSKKAEVNPPKPFEMGVVSMNPCARMNEGQDGTRWLRARGATCLCVVRALRERA